MSNARLLKLFEEGNRTTLPLIAGWGSNVIGVFSTEVFYGKTFLFPFETNYIQY